VIVARRGWIVSGDRLRETTDGGRLWRIGTRVS
jgi:hypothetical protein